MRMTLDPVNEVTTIITEEPETPPAKPKPRWKPGWRWEQAGLGAVLLTAAFLGLWNLSINGYSNQYYAAVRSMIQSWPNFFYVSFEVLTGVLLTLFLVRSSGWWIKVAQAQSGLTSSAVAYRNGFDGGMGGQQANQSMIQYLEANQGDYKYLLAVSNSQSAASIIIQTGKPVMSIGGFTGSDKTITSTAQLEQMIANHTVRYFMLGGGGGPGGGSSVVSQYV